MDGAVLDVETPRSHKEQRSPGFVVFCSVHLKDVYIKRLKGPVKSTNQIYRI